MFLILLTGYWNFVLVHCFHMRRKSLFKNKMSIYYVLLISWTLLSFSSCFPTSLWLLLSLLAVTVSVDRELSAPARQHPSSAKTARPLAGPHTAWNPLAPTQTPHLHIESCGAAHTEFPAELKGSQFALVIQTHLPR